MARAVLALAALIACGCATQKYSSEREWQRGQCGQIIDEEARKKCLERLENDYPTKKAPSR